VKACPTGSIRFGSRHEMLAYGETKVGKLRDRGFDDAVLYDPSGVGSLHMMYVLPRGNMLDDYGLPEDPEVKSTFSFIGALRALRGIGAVGIWAGVIGSAVYWLRTGRKRPPPEADAAEEAERLGQPSVDGTARAGAGSGGQERGEEER
jgi:formate dehydrogenase iron-sulfur subunit